MNNRNIVPSKEQQLIVDSAIAGNSIAISAGAGCAKTSTCKLVAESMQRHSLYVSYNKAIATEAAASFPSWVECRTMHSLAWRSVVKGTKFRKKLGGFLDKNDLLELIPELKNTDPDEVAAITATVMLNVGRFCNSDQRYIRKFLELEDFKGDISTYINETVTYWYSMVDVNSSTKIHHDTYLKIFQLNQPKLGYEILYLDECQDANPVILDIVLRQKCQTIAVGDPNQAIYAWRGAVNMFNRMPKDFKLLELTTSYRFNQNIAQCSNAILKAMASSTSQISGVYKGTAVATRAILVRTNIDLFTNLADYVQTKTPVHIIGDLTSLYSQLYSAQNLRFNGDPTKRYDKQIASYKTWAELLKGADTSPELKKVIGIINNFPNIHEIITGIKGISTTADKAKVILATAHKSKGLEWDEVTLSSGFLPEAFLEMDTSERYKFLKVGQTGNLIYVAITRAKIKLNLPFDIQELIYANEE